MSRTDKTDPSRVKNARYGRLVHDHRNGECDPRNMADRRYWGDEPCWLTLEGNRSYMRQLRNYERPAVHGWWANKDERSARRKLRDNTRNILLTADWEADVEPVRHRHNAFWETI